MTFLILFILALIISSVGFYKFVYFISLGYGFSIAALGIALVILFPAQSLGTALSCILFVIYGFRLGGYLLVREYSSAAYRQTMKNDIKDGSNVKMPGKIAVWTSCALLYVLEISPVYFRLANYRGTDVCLIVGVIIMICGIALESTADYQKSKAKAKNPKRFCDSGVFRFVRCPNYLGEVLFWTGVFVSGFSALHGFWQWLAAFCGWACIVYIMFGGARRLELRQNRNYGDDPEYQAYVKKTPILLPLVPLYSVADYKWLVG